MTVEIYLRSLMFISVFYFGTAAFCFGILYKWSYLKKRKLNSELTENLTPQRQIMYAGGYFFAAAFLDALFVSIAYAKYTKIYTQINYMGVLYFIGSFLIYILGYEIFYYFAHRLLHTNFLYKHVHYVHHRVRSPTVLSIYCFHPLEALGYFIFHMSFVLLVPIHPTALLISSLFLHQGNVTGHLGYEIFPDKFKNKFTFLNSATGHFYHHQYQTCNYGYTFTILDKIFKTFRGSAGTNQIKDYG
ncbi:MAG: sterol desaturase family protein [Bdellovibrionaceae bacterium]|nr:sterol desaturase family protein [Pseudobdellovibrionaceae bacterium]